MDDIVYPSEENHDKYAILMATAIIYRFEIKRKTLSRQKWSASLKQKDAIIAAIKPIGKQWFITSLRPHGTIVDNW
jgi:hypothetical protein